MILKLQDTVRRGLLKLRNSVLPAVLAAAAAACSPEMDPEQPVVVLPPEQITLTYVSETSLTFTWAAVEGAEAYTVRLEDESGTALWEQITATSYTFEGLETGRKYYFKVKVRTADGESGYSAAMEVIPGESVPGPAPDPDPEPDPGPVVPAGDYEKFLIPAAEDRDGAARAFPGAEGGGMYVTGGRGGRVIHVTNLNDSGAGSLRAAVNESGPRTIVFDVAGIIELESQLRIKNGNLTIAGQTAPGDGICIKNYSTVVEADNVIVRFVRFRLGNKVLNTDGEDCIWGRRQRDIILDHCSMSWSIDECASFYGNENFTMQWCILTESLKDSNHPKGEHGYGGIWGGKNASFHHNMLANHDSRNPRFDHPQIYENPDNPARRGNVDYRNNVVFNWGSNNTYGGEGGWFNLVNNYYRQGADSRDRGYFYDVNGIYTSKNIDYGYPELYVSGNVYVEYPEFAADNLLGLYWHDDKTNDTPSDAVILTAPLGIGGPYGETVYTSTHSAYDAFDAVCDFGGASLVRDEVDARAARDAKAGTGAIIDLPSEVGGWPEYAATDEELSAAKDSDGDGMPDWFETEFGLDPVNASDGNSKSLDSYGRYTNLEMYLHYIVREIISSQNSDSVYTAL